MDTIKSLKIKIDKKTINKPIFFVTNDPERGLGLEKLLENYHILCIDDNGIVDYLIKENVKVFSLEKEMQKTNPIFRNSNRLLNHNLTQKYIKENTKLKNGYLMFFKIAPNLATSARKLGFDILNTSSKLNHKFELKLSQYESIKYLDIKIPKTVITILRDADYKDLTKKLGKNFIIQFNRGHTGTGTIKVNSNIVLDEIKNKFPKRKVKITKHIYGPAYTLNACITKHGVCWGGLSYQITGIEECTSYKAGTVGNDWYYPKDLKKDTIDKIDKYVKIIGNEMARYNFKGMFGLDIVIDKNTNEPYIIEINARQPASIPMFNKLQILNNQIPLQMLAIAEFLNIDYDIDIETYNNTASKHYKAAQLFIRNKNSSSAKIIGGIKVGSYRVVGDNSAYDWSSGKPKLKKNVIITDENKDMPLIFKEESYSIEDLTDGGMLILCSKEGKNISQNSEVARIQILRTIINKNRELTPWLKNIIKGLNKYIVLKKNNND